MPRRPILLFAAACLALAAVLAGGVVLYTQRAPATVAAPDGPVAIGGPFQLVNQDGRAVDESLLRGRWSLVFFGFTYCPDYCPTTLQSLAATRDRLGPLADDLQIVFISVDPARDTPQALKTYLDSDAFPPGVVGLTGSPAQVDGAARAYRAFYERVGDGDDYVMNHGLTIYLMGPDGRFRSPLAHDLGPERSADLIRRVMARG